MYTQLERCENMYLLCTAIYACYLIFIVYNYSYFIFAFFIFLEYNIVARFAFYYVASKIKMQKLNLNNYKP